MDRLGDRALRFPRPTGVPVRAIVREVRSWPGVVDVVVTREDIAAYFDRAPAIDERFVRALANAEDDPDPPRTIEIPVGYDGDDLVAIASATKLDVDEVIRIHSSGTYVVETMGFAPGFAYLSGLDPRLHLPRRATPRPRVYAGSVAIAGDQTAVYPSSSPGGWHIVGRTSRSMLDSDGALLRLGDRVRFTCC